MIVSVSGEFSIKQEVVKTGSGFYAGEYTVEDGVRLFESPYLRLLHVPIGKDMLSTGSSIKRKLINLAEENAIWLVTIHYPEAKAVIVSNDYEETINVPNINTVFEAVMRAGRIVLEFVYLNDDDKEEHLFSFVVPQQGIQLFGDNHTGGRMMEWQRRN